MAHSRHQLVKLLLLPFIPLMKTIRLILSSIVALSLILLLFISKTLLFFSKPFLPVIAVLWRLLMWLMFPLFFICLRPLQNFFSSNNRNPKTGFRLFSPPITPNFTQIPP